MSDQEHQHIPTPWEPEGLFTEENLRAAQEYFYQTHATNARLITEGRQAKGFMKSYTRHKLEKSMGEDFKMYTGTHVGDEDAEASLGIRGDMNTMLEVIYRKINPYQPITSPVQEDLVILTHPFGGLEVCYSMVFFYTDLMKKYVTLVGNRRKVLKSILDEEYFKWLWRTCMHYFLSEDATKINFHNNIHSGGLPYIPAAEQRNSTVEKIQEIGHFLLGQAMSESQLRFSMAFYYVSLLQHIHYMVLSKTAGGYAENAYKMMVNYKEDAPSSDILVTIDHLLHMKGNSGDSFDDILQNEDEGMEKYIPAPEIEFISQFRPYDHHNAVYSVSKLIPTSINRDEGGSPTTLMPLLLALRVLPFTARTHVIQKIPGPFLSMMVNRLGVGGDDDRSVHLSNHLKEEIDVRRKSGETYSIATFGKAKAVTTTVRPPAGSSYKPAASPSVYPAQRPPAPPIDADRELTPVAKAPPPPVTEEPPADKVPAAQPEPPTVPGVAPKPDAASATSGPISLPILAGLLDERIVVRWRMRGNGVEADSTSLKEFMRMVGTEPRHLAPIVLLAIQTGQVFMVPPEKVSRDLLENLLHRLRELAPKGSAPRLSADQREHLVKEKLLPRIFPEKVMALAKAQSLGLGRHREAAESLNRKLGGKFESFVRQPGQPEFRAFLSTLSVPEKLALTILHRVSRLG